MTNLEVYNVFQLLNVEQEKRKLGHPTLFDIKNFKFQYAFNKNIKSISDEAKIISESIENMKSDEVKEIEKEYMEWQENKKDPNEVYPKIEEFNKTENSINSTIAESLICQESPIKPYMLDHTIIENLEIDNDQIRIIDFFLM